MVDALCSCQKGIRSPQGVRVCKCKQMQANTEHKGKRKTMQRGRKKRGKRKKRTNDSGGGQSAFEEGLEGVRSGAQ